MTTNSVVSAFRVLQAVAETHPIGLSEVARKVELPKSTVQRILSTLRYVGWLQPATAQPLRWELAPGPVEVLSQLSRLEYPASAALPIMVNLGDTTTETISLSTPAQGALVVRNVIHAPHHLRAFRTVGEILPMRTSASGLAFLAACMSPSNYTYPADLRGPASAARDSEETWITQLEATFRCCGYMADRGEEITGVNSVAAPVLDHRGPVAVLSVSGPQSRIPPGRLAELGEHVRKAAARIGAALTR